MALAASALIAVPAASAQDAPAQQNETNSNSVTFSVTRGYITGPVTVELSGADNIIYSTSWGRDWAASDFNGQPYTGPITINGSTQLRAMAVGDEHVVSHTYIDISNYSAGDRAVIEQYPAMVTTGASLGSRDVDARTIVEFWHPNGTSASAPAGIRNRQNGTGQHGDFRLYFRGEYGDGRLDYDLFPTEDSGAQTAGAHDKVNFHGGSQDGLGWGGFGNPGCAQPGTFMRDRFFQGLQRELNGDGVSGQYYLMWDRGRLVGLKNAEDVPHEGFMDEHFGGGKDNYGNWGALQTELPYANSAQLLNTVDLVNYVDYLLVQWLGNNADWAWLAQQQDNNVVAGGLIAGGPYYHWAWDMHLTLIGCQDLWGIVPNNPGSPLGNSDLRALFADRAYLHFENGGALTPAKLGELWDNLSDEVAPGVPLVYSNVSSWQSGVQYVRGQLTGNLSATFYNWLKSNNLASNETPVSYSLPAGDVPSASSVTLSGGGEIWFTTDGTDPRAPGGAVAGTAQRYAAPIGLPDGTVQMLARTKSGNAWSAARPMIFHVGAPSLIISESNAEFVEITNTGTTGVDLEYWRLQGDVRYKFDFDRSPVITPGQSIVIAEDADVFAARWGREPDGQFLDALNGNRPLRLVDAELNTQYEVDGPVIDDGAPYGLSRPDPVAANPPGLILNEWNAVKSSNTTSDPDPVLGTVAGNGGDWFETVTVNDADLRGWQLETSDADTFPTPITLTNNAVWADVPAGTIITFSQDPVAAADGTVYGTDVSLDPDNGDWWIHIVTDEANPYVNQTVFPASSANWNLEIRSAAGVTQWGPVGEGIGALPGGVSSSEIGELETTPSPSLDPVTAPYDDGDGSTFGAPNTFGDAIQNFSFLRGIAAPGLNVDCDNTLTSADAQHVLDYLVGNRSNTNSCPLTDPGTQLNPTAGDINQDGTTSLLDALIIAQCAAGVDNSYCPTPE